MNDIANAFAKYPRHLFLPPEQVELSRLDAPLSIGYGQTNSHPSTVRSMLEWLEVEPGHTVLDVGSGSGWTTALLSHLTGPKGRVYAVEKVPELMHFGQTNCLSAGVKNARFYVSKDQLGLKKYAKYDRILVSASAPELPKQLLDQLKNGGKMVIPVKNAILEITKNSNEEIEIINHSGYVFVPLLY